MNKKQTKMQQNYKLIRANIVLFKNKEIKISEKSLINLKNDLKFIWYSRPITDKQKLDIQNEFERIINYLDYAIKECE